MKYKLSLLALVLTGCAQTVSGGLRGAQVGLAAVDLGTDAAAQAYAQAVSQCEMRPEPACARLGSVEDFLAKLEIMGAAYGTTSDGLRDLEKAWADIAPHIEAALEILRRE